MPQNCETSYRGMDNSYSMESRDLNSTTISPETAMNNVKCDNIVNNHLDSLSSTLYINDNRANGSSLLDDTKFTRRDNLSGQGKIASHSPDNQHHHHTPIETTRSINHLVPCKKVKLIDGDSIGIIGYPDTTINSKTIDNKLSSGYMVTDSNRKIANHHHNPMGLVDVNRVDKYTNSISPSPGTINSSIYSYESKLINPLGGNTESVYHSSVNHSLIKPYPSSTHIDSSSSSSSSSSSGRENHSPKRSTCETINFQTPLKLRIANFPLMVPSHNDSISYTVNNDCNLMPPSGQLNRLNRSDKTISISTEQPVTINKHQSPTSESLTLLGNNSHVQGTINRSISSSSSPKSSSCSSVDKILPMINVVSLNNETTTTSSSTTKTTSTSYNKETIPTISDRSKAIMNVPDFVNDYSTSHIYSNSANNNSDSKDSFQSISSVVHQSPSADLRWTRFKETWDFLNKSDLIDVTLKTANLMKRNQSLQREIERLKEEVAKIIPSSRLCDDNQLRVNNICIENSA